MKRVSIVGAVIAALCFPQAAAGDDIFFATRKKLRDGTDGGSPEELNKGGGDYTTEPNEYWHIIVVRPNKPAYQIMFGPDPTVDPATDPVGVCVIRDCPTVAGHQELVVKQGAAYFIGPQPYGGTEGGSSVGEGTIFVVQGHEDTNPTPVPLDDYIIYLDEGSGDYMTVYNRNNTSERQSITEINQYSTIADDGTIVGVVPGSVRDLPTADPIRRSLWETIKLLVLFGIDRPPPF